MRVSWLLVGLFAVVSATAHAGVVINEFQYNDGGTDDREFVELFNNTGAVIDISGWSLGGQDNGTTNPIVNIPGTVGSGTTLLAAGDYYVIGNTGVANVDQVEAGGFLENTSETLELFDGAFDLSTLQDGVVYEGFRGPTPVTTPGNGYGVLTPGMVTQMGDAPVWGITSPADLPGGLTTTSVGRFADGRDTNSNGRDFGLRPASPGAANSTTTMTQYVPPNVDGLNDGDAVSGLTGSFVGARAMTPGTILEGLNQNAIPSLPGVSKVITAWDGAGGGNAVISNATFAGGAQKFDIMAYIDTENMPLSANNAVPPVNFRGSELSFFGLGGSIDGSVGSGVNLTNISGTVGTNNDSAIGATGVAWYYEKVSETTTGNGVVSEKLYLIDAGDGGNMNLAPGNATADEWTVLQTIDLSTEASAWRRLGIEIDAAGNGVATFDDQTFNFTTAAGLYGSFYTAYRENTQANADLVPGYLRPPTFSLVTETPGDDADFDDDGDIDGADFLAWQRGLGSPGDNSDGYANGDNQVTGADLEIWKDQFAASAVAAVGAVPEPSTCVMLIVGLIACQAAGRRRAV